MSIRRIVLLFGVAVLSGCSDTSHLASLEPGEWLPGGESTNTRLLGRNAFIMPAANLDDETDSAFFAGNSFFNLAWVEAPASTTARDGLGPFFNARSCSACHFRDGRAAAPEAGTGPFVGLLFRLSVPGETGPEPHPIYGNQLQDQAIPGVPVEGLPHVEWSEVGGRFDDGTPYSLAVPSYSFRELNYGELNDELMVSPRIAPQVIGLGLLEAIPEARLVDLADPYDLDGDGISGRVQRHADHDGGGMGRFGWKGEAATVAQQVADAFAGDMGLTNPLKHIDDCTASQTECLDKPLGVDPSNPSEAEVQDFHFGAVVTYTRSVAVPVRRNASDAQVLHGKAIFSRLNCDGCHTPRHITEGSDIEAFNGQTIWPYTDLLLHDMGEALADHRPVGKASGLEWRTPPLWGLGLIEAVNGHTRFLHDGRARNLSEAILWHGGEATNSRDGYKALTQSEREALIAFLEDL